MGIKEKILKIPSPQHERGCPYRHPLSCFTTNIRIAVSGKRDYCQLFTNLAVTNTKHSLLAR